jgi:surface antigen
MPRCRSGLAALVVATALSIVLPCSVEAQLMPLMKTYAGPGLSKDDLNRLRAASSRLYEGRSIGTVERWRNPDTGNSGSVTLARSFEFNGMPCRSLDYSIRYAKSPATPGRYSLSWCKTSTGEWKTVETGAPAPPP